MKTKHKDHIIKSHTSGMPRGLGVTVHIAHTPVRLAGLADWESGEVKLCLLPTSSEGEVGNDDIGGVCARRVGSTVVVG